MPVSKHYTISKGDHFLIERTMKRLDDGKISLVEFLNSIKFAQHNVSNRRVECVTHFAHFNPRARAGRAFNAEDSHLIRSAN